MKQPQNPQARPAGKPRATAEPRKKDGPKRSGTSFKAKRGDKPRKNRKLCARHRKADAKRRKKARQVA